MLKFETIIDKHEGIDAAFVVVPYDIEQIFGAKRVKVNAKFDGHEYRGSVVRMGDSYIIGITKEMRAKIKKQAGDKISVELEKDEEERAVEIDEDLKEVIEKNEIALLNYENLSYTEKKSINKWIQSAKNEDTKALRIGKTVENLMKM